MKFKDEEIEKLDLSNVDDIVQLIIVYLCGEKHDKQLSESDTKLLEDLLNNARQRDLNYEQFNELLLLLNQVKVSNGFFKKFFWGKDSISLDELRKGVTEFRGFAMLCFGNFRFAYKNLIQKDEKQLKKIHKSYCKEPTDILEEFERPQKMLRIDLIGRNETWYLGNISKQKLEKEYEIVESLISSVEENKKGPLELSKEELLEVSEKYLKMQETMISAQDKALRNTDIYLIWDYMDVYIATSMRHKWEFQETFDFINEVFGDSKIEKLNLRYFDPTQSKCKNRIDKGLVEGLMLKRVQCCIYMAQESDTMGKDSELAATLAQGKPVIAYIPTVNIDEYSEKFKRYPLDYFEKRLLILQAEEIFDDKECDAEFKKCDNEFGENISRFQKDLDNYRNSQPLTLWEEKENEFKCKNDYFDIMCRILATAEYYHFEKRAAILKEHHPLAIQVDLRSGVANGVLVARSIKECAKLLYQVLTNEMEFTIRHKDEGITALEEKVSGCPFRVVTDNEKLTNSFWNFYLTSE